MKFASFFAAAALPVLAVSALAVSAQAQDVGVTVNGNDGAAVGTVLSNDGSVVVVDTGSHQVPLPANVFANADGQFTLNTTKTELDAMMAAQLAEAAAARDAALVEGAAVVTADAQALGSVSQIDGDAIVVRKEDFVITLPRDLFAVDASGNVMVRANMDAIQAAVAGA